MQTEKNETDHKNNAIFNLSLPLPATNAFTGYFTVTVFLQYKGTHYMIRQPHPRTGKDAHITDI